MNRINKIRLIYNTKNILNNKLAYKNALGTLEKAFWRISYEDLLMSSFNKFKQIILHNFIVVISSIRKKNKEDILRKILYRWKFISNILKNKNNDKEKQVRLKLLLLRHENNHIKILSKFLNKWKYNTQNLINNEMNNNFCNLLIIWYDKDIINSKKDLINNLCRHYIYIQGQKFSKLKIRKLFINSIFQKIRKAFIPLIIKLNIRKLIISTKVVENNNQKNYLISIIRKWRFITFVSNLVKKKLQLMYNNLHVSYLEIADEIFNTPQSITPKDLKSLLLNYDKTYEATQIDSFVIKELGFDSEESYKKLFGKK